jgi:uncharacterized protein
MSTTRHDPTMGTSLLRLCWLALALLLGTANRVDAQPVAAQVAVPPLRALVTDLTGTLTPDQQARLEARLRQFEERKGTQIAVLVVPTTRPEEVEQYAMRVVEQWKLGRKKVDDGVLLLVAKNDRAMRIEVGYGLEGVLNDATAKRIVSEVITPRFREGDYFAGIDAATDRIARLVEGEALPAPAAQGPAAADDIGRLAPLLLLIALVAGSALRAALGRVPGSLVTGAAVGGAAWLLSGTLAAAVLGALIAFVFTLLGAGMHGGWHGGSHGRGGHHRGGFGGGGFRGGGGGGFGGGGASGRW